MRTCAEKLKRSARQNKENWTQNQCGEADQSLQIGKTRQAYHLLKKVKNVSMPRVNYGRDAKSRRRTTSTPNPWALQQSVARRYDPKERKSPSLFQLQNNLADQPLKKSNPNAQTSGQKSEKKGKENLQLFHRFQKAFDTIRHKVIWATFKSKGVEQTSDRDKVTLCHHFSSSRISIS